MSASEKGFSRTSKLRAGDWVEVRSADEILATLDERGCLDALPFMPEMLPYCGKRFRVYKSAHKTCDTLKDWKTIRSMANAVHLEGIRCDGGAHGDCQAACLIFWKQAWLKPVQGPDSSSDRTGATPESLGAGERGSARCDRAALERAACLPPSEKDGGETRYSCQATQHFVATTPLRWWDPRPYLRDLTSGNVGLLVFARALAIAAYNNVMRLNRRGRPFPYVRGLAGDETPTQRLDLREGELVQVRSKEEIMRTINPIRKNRGLYFDEEMVPYCGKTFRVLRRVVRLIDEKTGKMIHLSNPCIILEGVYCSGCLSRYRLFCPRSIYSFWREIWLKRLDAKGQAGLPERER